MRTYNTIPKKYSNIETAHIKVIGDYAYTVYRAWRTGQRDYVYRMTVERYNKIREEAKTWDVCRCDPTEETLQQEIAWWLFDLSGYEPYIQTTPYL